MGFIAFQSCYYNNVEDLYPTPPECDTTNISFSGSVQPILNDNCTAHHSGPFPSAGVSLTNYEEISAVALSGRLISVIKHEDGWPAMPFGEDQLPECDIHKIEAWVNSGAPDN